MGKTQFIAPHLLPWGSLWPLEGPTSESHSPLTGDAIGPGGCGGGREVGGGCAGLSGTRNKGLRGRGIGGRHSRHDVVVARLEIVKNSNRFDTLEHGIYSCLEKQDMFHLPGGGLFDK